MQMKQHTFLAAAALALAILTAVPAPVLAAAPVSATAGRTVIRGLVTGLNGAAVPGANIEVFRYGTGLVTTVTAGPDGTFTADLPASAETLYWVRAWASGYDTAQEVAVTGRETPWVKLALKAQTGKVTGEVTGPGAKAIAGARVELLRTGYGIVAETTSDAGGLFAFDQVPAGSGLIVRVAAKGYSPALATLDSVIAGGTVTSRITLAAYSGRMEGRVIDAATEQPVAGARVMVERDDLGEVATAATAANGSFTADVPALTGAAYRATVAAPGYKPLRLEKIKLDEMGQVSLTGERQLRLEPLTTSIAGRVLDEDGKPVAGLPVMLEQQGAGLVAEATTDTDGMFRWTQVELGKRYRTRIATHEMVHDHNLRKWAPLTGDWITPEAGRVANLSLTVRAGLLHDYGPGVIRGLVTLPKGTPVAGARVELIRPGADKLIAETKTADDGSYRFADVEANLPRPGSFSGKDGIGYVVRVTAEGHYPVLSSSVDVTPDKESLIDLTLRPLRGSLAVRVVDQDGTALDLAELRLTPAESGATLVYKTSGGIAHMTAPAGQPYWLEAAKPGYRTVVLGPVEPSSDQETALDLVLQAQSGILTGQVTDQERQPLAGATVTAALPDGATLTATTGPNGGYTFFDLPAGAPLLVTAQRAGHAAAGTDRVITVVPGGKAYADLTLRAAAGTITGRVADEAGRPVAGTTVELWLAGKGSVDFTVTGEDGSFSFKAAPADPDRPYAVRVAGAIAGVRQAGYRTPMPLFRLEPGQTVYLQFIVAQ